MKSVHIIGVPLDLGGGRRGVDMGPSAFRIAGLGERLSALGNTVFDAGDLVAPIPETKSFGDPTRKYIREIVRVCEKLYKTSLGVLEKGGFAFEGVLRRHVQFPNLRPGELCDVLCYARILEKLSGTEGEMRS